MSQHEQVNKVNTDGKRSNYGRQPSCKQFRASEREEGSLKLEKHFIGGLRGEGFHNRGWDSRRNQLFIHVPIMQRPHPN